MAISMGIRKRSERIPYMFHCSAQRAFRYVAKIIFTYILGYKVDIGHLEAVNLISSSKYSEKQIVCFRFMAKERYLSR